MYPKHSFDSDLHEASFGDMELLAEEPGIFASFGIHPHEAKFYDQMEDRVIKNMSHPKVVAWGECGLDFNKVSLFAF